MARAADRAKAGALQKTDGIFMGRRNDGVVEKIAERAINHIGSTVFKNLACNDSDKIFAPCHATEFSPNQSP
jgi:hypothetical protein